MAKDEILTNSRFSLKITGVSDKLIVKKVSGLSITLDTAGDMKPFGVTKDGTAYMQATVAGVTSGTITVEFVATAEDKSLHDWFRDSHPIGGPSGGGGSPKGGKRTDAILTVYNQKVDKAGAAQWDFTGVFPKSYKTSKMDPTSKELFTETVEFVYETCTRKK